jgi:hypothetical protein
MDAETDRKDWARVGVCVALAGFGLSAVPFVGTKYGDWPEATALAIGLLPLIYIMIHTVVRFRQRIQALEDRVAELERRK